MTRPSVHGSARTSLVPAAAIALMSACLFLFLPAASGEGGDSRGKDFLSRVFYLLKRDIQSGCENRVRAAVGWAAESPEARLRALVVEALDVPAAEPFARSAVLARPDAFEPFASLLAAKAAERNDAELMFAFARAGDPALLRAAYSAADSRLRRRLLAYGCCCPPPDWLAGLAAFEAENSASRETAAMARLAGFVAGGAVPPPSLLARPPSAPPAFLDRLADKLAENFDDKVRAGLVAALEGTSAAARDWGWRAMKVLLSADAAPTRAAVAFLAAADGVPPGTDEKIAPLIARAAEAGLPLRRFFAAAGKDGGCGFPWFSCAAACRARPEFLAEIRLPDPLYAPRGFAEAFAEAVAAAAGFSVRFELHPALPEVFWARLIPLVERGGFTGDFASSLAASALRAENISLADLRRMEKVLAACPAQAALIRDALADAAGMGERARPVRLRWKWEIAFRSARQVPPKMAPFLAALFLSRGCKWAERLCGPFDPAALGGVSLSLPALVARPALVGFCSDLCARAPSGPLLDMERFASLHPGFRPLGRTDGFALFSVSGGVLLCRELETGVRELLFLPRVTAEDARFRLSGGVSVLQVKASRRPSPLFRRMEKDLWVMELAPLNAASDPDGDGLSTREELELGTDPLSADTDRDGKTDGADPSPLVPEEEDAVLRPLYLAAALQAGLYLPPRGAFVSASPVSVGSGTAALRLPFRQCVLAPPGTGMKLPLFRMSPEGPVFEIRCKGRTFLLYPDKGRYLVREGILGVDRPGQ